MRRTFAAAATAALALTLAACCCENRCRPCCSPCGPNAGAVAMTAPSAPAAATAPAAPTVPVAPAPSTAAAEAPYNATCPVLLGNPVDARYTTVYKGKVVGFCCPMCKAKFEKDPEKYAKNLP